MNTPAAMCDLPYRLWGGALLLCATLHAGAFFAPQPRRPPAEAAPGFTVAAPHVGQVRVIPLASAALVSPCAARDAALPAPGPSLAEL